MRLADYPHMKKEDRRKWHRDMHRLAYPKTHETGETLSMEALAERIRGLARG